MTRPRVASGVRSAKTVEVAAGRWRCDVGEGRQSFGDVANPRVKPERTGVGVEHQPFQAVSLEVGRLEVGQLGRHHGVTNADGVLLAFALGG
jgi:hypothetical protein